MPRTEMPAKEPDSRRPSSGLRLAWPLAGFFLAGCAGTPEKRPHYDRQAGEYVQPASSQTDAAARKAQARIPSRHAGKGPKGPSARPAASAPRKAAPEAAAIKPPVPDGEATGFTQIGVISYYGRRFHGRKTASGESFDMHAMTAAHRTLPFGTRVKVTNISNGRSVVVRINDRGPFKYKRILDVSRGAAEALGMIRSGTVRARVAVLD